MAFLSNYLLSGIGDNDWRWMLGVQAIPASIYTLCVLIIPASPRWLVSKGRINEAKNVVKIVNPDQDSDLLISQMEDDHAEAPRKISL